MRDVLCYTICQGGWIIHRRIFLFLLSCKFSRMNPCTWVLREKSICRATEGNQTLRRQKWYFSLKLLAQYLITLQEWVIFEPWTSWYRTFRWRIQGLVLYLHSNIPQNDPANQLVDFFGNSRNCVETLSKWTSRQSFPMSILWLRRWLGTLRICASLLCNATSTSWNPSFVWTLLWMAKISSASMQDDAKSRRV